jgi:hypothetical protein
MLAYIVVGAAIGYFACGPNEANIARIVTPSHIFVVNPSHNVNRLVVGINPVKFRGRHSTETFCDKSFERRGVTWNFREKNRGGWGVQFEFNRLKGMIKKEIHAFLRTFAVQNPQKTPYPERRGLADVLNRYFGNDWLSDFHEVGVDGGIPNIGALVFQELILGHRQGFSSFYDSSIGCIGGSLGFKGLDRSERGINNNNNEGREIEPPILAMSAIFLTFFGITSSGFFWARLYNDFAANMHIARDTSLLIVSLCIFGAGILIAALGIFA